MHTKFALMDSSDAYPSSFDESLSLSALYPREPLVLTL